MKDGGISDILQEIRILNLCFFPPSTSSPSPYMSILDNRQLAKFSRKGEKDFSLGNRPRAKQYAILQCHIVFVSITSEIPGNWVNLTLH